MRVIVVDDMLLLREGLVAALRRYDVDVVGEAASANGLLAAVDRLRADAVVLDIRMPPTFTDEGLVAAADLRRARPDVGVLVLSQYLETIWAHRLLETAPGRVGYLLKDRVADVAVVVDALRRIVDGETVVDPTIVSRLLGRGRQGGSLGRLTTRELEVLAAVAEGLSNQAVADRLHIGERTVEAHTAAIFAKLGLGETTGTHRRVLAVLTYLRATG